MAVEVSFFNGSLFKPLDSSSIYPHYTNYGLANHILGGCTFYFSLLRRHQEGKVMDQREVELIVLDEQDIDQISILPESITHYIMSFLPTSEVAITSALSKKFYSLWSSFPIIDFDQKLFIEKPGTLDLESSRARQQFLDFVVASIYLRQLKTDLEKFSLKCYLGKIKSDPRIDLAINFALNYNVKDLRLNFCGYGLERKVKYVLKETFDLKSVTYLKLKGVQLNLNWLVSAFPLIQCLTLCRCFVVEDSLNPSGNDITFTRGQLLKVLSFKNVNIPEAWFKNYICKLSNLEILRINMCKGLRRIRVSNRKLKEVEFNYNVKLVSIEVEAPELVSFRQEGWVFPIQHQGLICKPCTIDIAACKSIKNLFFKSVHVTDDWIRKQVSLFCHLEKLRLEDCVQLIQVHIANNHLQALELLECKHLVDVNIDTPNLNSFNYRGALVRFSLMNSPRLRNPTLSVLSNFLPYYDLLPRHYVNYVNENYVPPTNVWYAGMRDFLMLFNHCDAVMLVCDRYQDIIFPKDVKDPKLSPLYDIKSLSIKFRFGRYIDAELVASLLWISPNVETLFFTTDHVEKFIKLQYEKTNLANNTTACCYNLPIKCWRHYVKGIEMHNLNDDDDKEGLLAYFKEECQVVGNDLQTINFLGNPIF